MYKVLLIFVLLFGMIIGLIAKPEMVRIPAGKMDIENESGNLIAISLDSFELAKYELTVGEFRKFVKATGYLSTADINEDFFGLFASFWMSSDVNNWENPGFSQADNHPVGGLSWYDAVSYCNWLSLQEGLTPAYNINKDSPDPNNDNDDDYFKWTVTWNSGANGYRLPTVMEWEYAAREGGKDMRYPWGNETIAELNNPRMAGNLADKSFFQELLSYQSYDEEVEDYYKDDYDDGYAFSAPIGSFIPNVYGLYDMSGNVSELCWDWLDLEYYPQNGTKNPKGPTSGEIHAHKGAAWCDNDYASEISYRRDPSTSIMNFSYVGMRLARSVK